jgi:hypothetical protein
MAREAYLGRREHLEKFLNDPMVVAVVEGQVVNKQINVVLSGVGWISLSSEVAENTKKLVDAVSNNGHVHTQFF